jgi:acetoin utilization deacetylase AcuC-like enzyme
MPTLYYHHSASLNHETAPGHPERPDRMRAIEQGLAQDHFKPLVRIEAPEADFDTVALCHSNEYIDELRHISPKEGMIYLDGDTSMSPGTLEAALRATGGAVAAVDAVMTNTKTNAFVGTRPPGHHAETAKPMGFCFFDSAAIAARYAQRKYGISRAAVVDFDVHHGNGSQEIFWSDPTVMYASTHQMPLFPGTGSTSERGEKDTVVNAPLRAGNGGREFREAFELAILPRLEQFAPELIVISAGFDAHWRDPLGSLELKEEDYAWVTRKLMEIADKSAQGRIVSVLEGGYDLQGLRDSVAVHVAALMNN